ncbi:hypothetical protein OQJ15_02365 [Fluoribacter dumoffii]|uniref:FlgN protein n=1 Tax=Fluoribacter dumoffii TaxID=463 RepID=A0A377G863_9GAMM|nr:hypothetical protein [Fluoribacter dumoffii]KTC89847.1 hypothetical protein Ldum_0915 [Fluoribacter dumoffii NY 23]MCW8385143.1 hypothetical protein [Fluoribacter dumoffii]MCW8496559.1 hypothetical protein [Fluoribacter dumoffii]STO20963.1 Uncharacterised protein [Fluoribacter dumoffii]
MSQNNSCYGLNLLPIYLDIIEERLESALSQLKNLQQMQVPSQPLDPKTLGGIIKYHEAQKINNQTCFEQCKQWRNDNPNEEQLHQIAHIEKSAAKLELVAQEILKSAEYIKGKNNNLIQEINRNCSERKTLVRKGKPPHRKENPNIF